MRLYIHKSNKGNNWNRFFTFVLTLLLVIYVLVTVIDQHSSLKSGEKLLAIYEENIKQQEIIARELEEEEAMIGTDEYIEQVARQKLGLCKTTEKLFVDTRGN